MWVGFHGCLLTISGWKHLGKLMEEGVPDGSVVRNICAMQETWVQSLGWEDPLEKRMDYPLHYSCSRNSMDRGVWQFVVYGVTKSWTQLKWLSTHAHALTSFCWPHLADLCWILTLYFWKWKCCSIGLQMVLNLAFGKMMRMGGFHCNCWFTDCRKKSPFTFQAL